MALSKVNRNSDSAKLPAVRFANEGRVNALVRKLASALADLPTGASLILPNGKQHTFGNGPAKFEVHINDKRALGAVVSLDLGRITRAYMDGALDIEGDMFSALDLRSRLSDRNYLHKIWRFFQPLAFGETKTNARAVRSHYDLDADFYFSFLDHTRCYTQGIFLQPDEPLDLAIRRKFAFCIDRCGLGRNSHVLEVVPSWGAFTSYAAERGIKTTALTNSTKSFAYMEDLGRQSDHNWNVVLADFMEYDSSEPYDAIVLMGIMEHLPNYQRVMEKFGALLKPGGYVYIDTSASRIKYEMSSFIHNNIYPGNHSFVLDEYLSAVAKSTFQLQEVHDDRYSYYLTFKQWAENFDSNRSYVVAKFGQRNFRRFRIYLWGAAHCFLTDRLQCYRVILKYPV